jgi:hypothetical protein
MLTRISITGLVAMGAFITYGVAVLLGGKAGAIAALISAGAVLVRELV